MSNRINVDYNMKKEYIRPEVEVIEVEPITMLAISSEGGLDVDGGNEPDEELSNRRRGQWGNLWAEK